MKIELVEISIRDLVKDYENNHEEGVFGYDKKLNIRPAYQREFVYKDKQRDEVVNTVRKDFPLNTMYWVLNQDDTYELLDGQQRTMSICEYVTNKYSIRNIKGNAQKFFNLTEEEQQQILNYKLTIYICEGEEREKLDWFSIVNISGEVLTEQELRNSLFTGPWLADAKRHFSMTNCPAYNLSRDYVKGSPIRQDFLRIALKWISMNNIDTYMSDNQKSLTAEPLWSYYQKVIKWTKDNFHTYRVEMKGLAWGEFYNTFKDTTFNATTLEDEIKKLMEDEDVTKKSGIYEYVLTGNESKLSIRAFDKRAIRTAYELQNGICVKCQAKFELKEMQADHIIAWSKGGKTTQDNLQMLCTKCNNTKSDS